MVSLPVPKHLVQGNEFCEVFFVVVSGDYCEVALFVHFVLNVQFGRLPTEQNISIIYLDNPVNPTSLVSLLWFLVSRRCPFHFRLTNISSCLGMVQKKSHLGLSL